MRALCTLRLIGDSLPRDLIAETMMPVRSYRFDRRDDKSGSAECLYFDVAEANDFSELTRGISVFLGQNQHAISKLKLDQRITERNLDLGLMVEENKMTATVNLDADLLDLVHRLGLTVSVAFYKTSPDEQMD